MFLDYYNLAEQPFGVTPDARFLYMGPQHREALASLVYGTESDRGFLAMIAEPGMGKTSLLYHYLSYVRNKARTAFVFRTDCDSREFIKHVLLDLGIDVAGMDLPTMHDRLNQLVIQESQAGRRVILVVDEAQNLDEKALESIRLLSNFETSSKKLMLIVLAGQPELANKLDRPSLSQLRQRISMLIRIEPFTPEQVNAYIDHRLQVAGGGKPTLFTPDARKMIAEHSCGIPRAINNLCFNALSIGCALRQETIDRDIVSEVIGDLDLAPLKKRCGTSAINASGARVKSEVVASPEFGPQEGLAKSIPILARIAVQASGGKGKDVVPARFYASKANDRSYGLVLRLTIAAMLFLVLVGTAGQIKRVESQFPSLFPSQGASVSARQVASAPPPLIPTHVAATKGSSIWRTSDLAYVMPGETLYHVCLVKFGKYDEGMLEKIRVLNPWMSDPDHLESGRRLFVPSWVGNSGDVSHPVDDPSRGQRTAAE